MKSHLAKPEPFRSGIYRSWSFRYPSLLLLVSTARCSPLSIACMQHTCLNPASLKFLPQQLRVPASYRSLSSESTASIPHQILPHPAILILAPPIAANLIDISIFRIYGLFMHAAQSERMTDLWKITRCWHCKTLLYVWRCTVPQHNWTLSSAVNTFHMCAVFFK